MLWLKIEKALKKQNKTLYWLAQKTDKDKSFFYSLKYGKKKTINFDTVVKIADALDISLEEFR